MQEVGGWTARGAVWLMETEQKTQDGRCKEKELMRPRSRNHNTIGLSQKPPVTFPKMFLLLLFVLVKKNFFHYWGLNLGSCTYPANALPLGYVLDSLLLFVPGQGLPKLALNL